MTPKISPSDLLNEYNYAILDSRRIRVTGRLYETFEAADSVCRSFNTNTTTCPFVVVEIDHDADTCVSVDADGEIVDSPTSEYDATLEALRYVYEMLDANELPTHSILDRLRGFCEHAGLLEFA
jgi:hypothetical protein